MSSGSVLIETASRIKTSTTRPRVLQVITKLDMGGAEMIALDLVAALHEHIDFAVATVLDPRDHSAVGQDMAATLDALQVPVFRGGSGHFKKGGVVRSAWRSARAVARFRPDMVHLHTEMPELTWAVAGLLSRRVRRVPVLRTVHNCELWISWAGMGRWVTQRLAKSRAVAVSHAAADADAAIATATHRERARVVYNGVSRTQADSVGPRRDGSFRVLFAGRLIAQKGPDLLSPILRSAHRLAKRPDVHVTLAGSGPLEADLRAAITGIAPDWDIVLCPPIERLASRLGDYDAVLMPSRYEGFGLLAIETLLAGVPLVTTRAPGLAEVLPHGYAFTADVEDADNLGRLLAQVIDDPASARATIAPLQAPLAQRFAPTTMIDAYAGEYGVQQ